MTVVTKNKLGQKLDEVQEVICNRYNRFYGDEASKYNYALAIQTLPGGMSTYFLGFNTKFDLIRAMYFIFGLVHGNHLKELNKKHCVFERLVGDHNEDDMNQPVSGYFFDDYEDWPRMMFGTGKQFECARQKGAF